MALNKFTFNDGDDSGFDEAYEKLINEILEKLNSRPGKYRQVGSHERNGLRKV